SASSARTPSRTRSRRRTHSPRRGAARTARCRGRPWRPILLLDVAPALERARQRHLVRVLEVRAHGDPARDARDPYAERREQPRGARGLPSGGGGAGRGPRWEGSGGGQGRGGRVWRRWWGAPVGAWTSGW